MKSLLIFSLLFTVYYLLFTTQVAQAAVPGPACVELPPKIDPAANYCEANQPVGEVTPGCVYAPSEDLLFCQGNNFRACDTDPQIEAPTPGSPNRNFWFPQDAFAGGKLLYNGATYDVPAGGVHICDSNVFACANSACLGGGDGAGVKNKFEGTTKVALSQDARFGSTIEYAKRISISGNQQAITETAPLSILISKTGEELLSKIKAAIPVGSSEDKLPAPEFPFLRVLSELNRRLTPATYRPEIKTDQIESYSYNPGCQVAYEQLPPPPIPLPGEQKVQAAIISSLDAQITTEGKITYDMSPSWGQDIANSKITQAVFVPDKAVKSEIVVKNPPPPGEEHNQYLGGGCPTGTGEPTSFSKNRAEGETNVPREAGLFAGIKNILTQAADFFDRFRQYLAIGRTPTTTIKLTHADKNICVGCSDLGQSITGAEGFVNAFLPYKNRVQLAEARLEAEKEVEASPGEVRNVEMVFGDVGNLTPGWNQMQKAVTPLKFQGLITRPIPSGPSIPLGEPGENAYAFLGEPKSQLLKNLISRAARQNDIPEAVLAAVAAIEGGHMWSYSDEQVRADFDPVNCSPNECSAAGPMQFTTGGENLDIVRCEAAQRRLNDPEAGWTEESLRAAWPNQWAAWGQGGNVCNISDSIAAAARKLKNDGGPLPAQSWICRTPEGEPAEVYRAAERYYGDCSQRHDRLGNLTYCEFVCKALYAE